MKKTYLYTPHVPLSRGDERGVWHMILRRKILLFSLLFLLVALPIVYLTLKYQSKTEAAWYNDSWGYRQRFEIANAGTTQTDFQVSITLNTSSLISAGKMQSDCRDLRIVDLSSKVIPHWIETNGLNACNQTATTIWVKASTLHAGGSSLFAYYGNSSAGNTSNGGNVFIFFDDFNNSAIDSTKWTNTGTLLSTSTSTASGRLRADRANGTGSLYSNITFARPFVLDMDYYPTQYPSSWEGGYHGSMSFGTFNSSKNTEHAWTPYGGGGSSYCGFCDDGGCYHGTYVNPLVTGNTLYKISMQAKSTIAGPQGVMTYTNRKDDGTGSQANNTIYTAATTGDDPLYIGVKDSGGNTTDDFEWDNWRVRKYADTMPAAGSPAAEEISPGPVAYWKFDEGYGTNAKDSTMNNNDGTISGSTWQSEDQCISGKCLYFDGSNDVVTVSNTVAGIKTVSFWVRPITTSEQFIDLNGSAYIQASSGTISATGFTSPTIYINGIVSSTIVANKWQYVTVTTETGLSGSAIKVGQISTNYGQAFFDDVKIYPYARTAAQIKSDFASKGSGSVKGTAASLGSSIKNLSSLSDGLVGYWKMDEASWNGTAGEVVDASGNENNGTAGSTGAAKPTTVSGKFANAGGFGDTGVDDYVTKTDSSSLSITGQGITLSAWINPDDNTGVDIIHKESHFTMALNDQCLTYADSITWNYATIGCYGSITTGSWQHVTVTFDGNTIFFYKNGEQIGSKVRSGSLTDNSNALYIGAYNTSQWFFDGKIDEVRIYNRALSSKEVRDLYNWAPGPVGYFPFDEKTGTTAYDRSNSSRTGTLQNSASWGQGKYGGALKLNVSGNNNDYMSLSSSITHNFAFSKEAWIYPTAITGCGAENRCSVLGPYFEVLSNLQFYSYQLSPSGWHSGGTINLNQWQHVATTYDGTYIKLFVNGVNVLSTAATRTGNFDATNIIGAFSSNSRNFKGYIDEVRVYDYARTAGQIVEDMNAGHPAPGSPVGSQTLYWKFDEGQGITANNSGNGGSNLNGSISGATWSNNGKYNKALDFTSDSVSKSDDDALDFGTDDFSVSFWAYHRDYTYPKALVGMVKGTSLGTNGNPGWQFGEGSVSSTYYIKLNDGTNKYDGGITLNTGSTATDIQNTWAHIVFVFSRSTGRVKLYMNGKKQTSEADISAVTGSINNTSSFIIGNVSGWQIDGLIDEVKIYRTALTSDEVKLDYNRGSAMVLGTMSDTSGLSGGSIASSSASAAYCIPGDTATCTSPVAEWKMDEGTGTTVYDTSGNGKDLPFGPSNAAPSYTNGKIGKGVQFSGNDFIGPTGSSNDSMLSITGPITVESWIKTNTTSAGGIVTRYNNSGTFTYGLSIDTNGTVKFKRGSYPDWSTSLNSTIAVNDNRWHFLSARYDGSTMKIFIDGVENNSTEENRTAGGGLAKFCIGNDAYYCDSPYLGYYTGQLDQVRIYDYARTPAQVAWDYNRGAPVGHWKFDECQGATAFDAAGSGNNGTITIGATGTNTSAGTCTGSAGEAWKDGATGKYNSSLEFDGADDYMTITDNSALNSNSITVAAWIKTSGTNNYSGIVDKFVNTGYQINVDNSSHLRFDIGGSPYTHIEGTTNLETGDWYFVTATYDGSIAKVFVNGKQENSVNYSGGITTSGQSLIIGNDTEAASRYFNGQIDDVRIYNYALTPVQIKQVYNNGAINFGPATGAP